MTEAQMLQALVEYVKEHKVRVASPDYLATRFYSAQWKIFGAVYYYQLPRNGKILALRNCRTGECSFSADGLVEPD